MFRLRKIVRWSLVLIGMAGLLSFGKEAAADEPQLSPEHKAILDRLEALVVFPVTQCRLHPGDLLGAESTDLDDSAWQAIQAGSKWKEDAAWLRCKIEIPAALQGYDIRGAALRLSVSVRGTDSDRLYINAVPVADAEEDETVLLAEHAVPGQKILLAIESRGKQAEKQLHGARILVEAPAGRPDPGVLRQELLSAEEMIQGISPNDAQRKTQLDAAYQSLDWTALGRGDQPAFDHSLEQAETAMQPLRAWMQTFSIRAAGNSHIDMAWLWPWTETVDVVHRTFSSALKLMREFPDLTYTHSSAAAYEWMEEKYPSLFDEIRQRVREGRWEPIGGMWVEPDLNMPDGESQVRQLLLGKRYFREKFGVDIRTGWNPDSFGYNWQLPQIYKKSGVDFFVTQKLAWNDTTKFPFKLFWWEAPDGSRVLAYFPHDYANPINPAAMAKDLAEYAPSMKYPEMLYLFGVGDHGGGPTRTMLRTAERWEKDVVYPRLYLGKVQPYFDELSKKAASLGLPVWRSELYLEFHRGVYTTQAETKKGNRRSEELLLTAEKFSSFATLFGLAYPKADLRFAWKKVLFNQFHDIAAGSGIAAVYRDAARDYSEAGRIGRESLRTAFVAISSQVNTQGAGTPLLVFNPMSWKRTDAVEADVQLAAPSENIDVLDSQGVRMLSQVLSQPGAARPRLRFIAQGVPPVGYKLFRAVPAAAPSAQSSPLLAGPDFLENEFLRVRVDPATGCITSLFHKKQQWEALAPSGCGNQLQAFADKPRQWDAWNIDADYEKQQWNLDAADEVKLVEQGPLRAVLRVRKHFQNSAFIQDIIMVPNIPRVDVAMRVEWHEKHILLKVAFPVAVKSDAATYEIPYGSVQRPTTRRTPEEQAEFEVPALRWADLSDGKHGFSLLNDCKYGYDTRDNVVRLTLLRSPEWPDPHADEGSHEFTYSFYPHAADWKQAETMLRGYELNNKLIPVEAASHVGSLPAEQSFLTLEPGNVLLSSVKQAEDREDILVRFYEFAGRATTARLQLPPGVIEVHDANLMEQPGQAVAFDGKTVSVSVGPYEIKTLRLRLNTPNTAADNTTDRR